MHQHVQQPFRCKIALREVHWPRVPVREVFFALHLQGHEESGPLNALVVTNNQHGYVRICATLMHACIMGRRGSTYKTTTAAQHTAA